MAAAMKHMVANFSKLDKFEGVDFRRWQKKMHFLLSTMNVIKKKSKWENYDYVCRGIIFNGMSDPLFDIYQFVESAKELWDSLEAKYMAEDVMCVVVWHGYAVSSLMDTAYWSSE
ncbi:hypothetical protein Tco_0104420 [Tanacetum coccineum]